MCFPGFLKQNEYYGKEQWRILFPLLVLSLSDTIDLLHLTEDSF